METLNIGDTVLWAGGFGANPEQFAKVTGIEITGGGKYGDAVESAPWSQIHDRNAVVTLDNGHWAYAEQIREAANG